ncbi:MAG: hypothetical protein CBARDCOR_0591 [uncultured Caballeronia sp.]|nr:MAG: hypothetical protein CBARDCOR_0591 [uncultured Caballeronia sp.]
MTGNYHCGLEALSQGKPTFGHLDNRVQSQLRAVTGALELPWIDAMYGWRKPKVRFVNCCGIGRYAQSWVQRRGSWMETYYQEAAMVEDYRRAILISLRHRIASTSGASWGIASSGLQSHCLIIAGPRASEPTARGGCSLMRCAGAENITGRKWFSICRGQRKSPNLSGLFL